ncbi:AAEL001386-PA [Aedes aegypti]|uniref:AAEL001386-PA n=1 Tax=Aedes aegypti TaxID=7159 RepID=Q17LE2_AEDAE|nr:AAEL001386-PA [Aedes aegypti]
MVSVGSAEENFHTPIIFEEQRCNLHEYPDKVESNLLTPEKIIMMLPANGEARLRSANIPRV